MVPAPIMETFMYKVFLVSFFALSAACAQAAPKLLAACSVSEIVGATGESKTTTHRFDGRLQTTSVELSLLRDARVDLKGAPGAVGDFQAFYLMAKIHDDSSGVVAIDEAYFVTNRKYSEEFARVVRGSLITRLIRKNGDKIEVACFNPEKQ